MRGVVETKWGELPGGWNRMPVRRLTEVRLSNVDKKTLPGQREIKLCNYTDVYHGSYLDTADHFMPATATDKQIRRFQLQVGDVLITKDSESNEDIARPALVAAPLDNTICGYHLALLRPRSISGEYLYWALESLPVNSEFTVRANGVTRFGLSSQAIKQAMISVPPRDVQLSIARFLNSTTAQIDEAIAAKRRLVELLEEERLAFTSELVAGDHSVGPLGFEQPESPPSGWEYMRLKRLLRELTARSTTGTEQLLSLRMRDGLVPTDSVLGRPVEPRHLVGYKLVGTGELVMNRMRASIGLFSVATTPGLVSPDYAVYEVNPRIDAHFLLSVLTLPRFGAAIRANSTGMGTGSSGFMRVYSDDLGGLVVPVPPPEHQETIINQLSEASHKSSTAIATAQRQIALLEEYRTVLIADAITGKLDLSAADSRTPETIAEEAVEVAAAREIP